MDAMSSIVPPPPLDEGGPFSAVDYVQLACMARRSARIVVSEGGRATGEILVWNGELWSARDRLGRGEEALARIVFAERGVVHVHTLSADAVGERELLRSWQHVLLDLARRHDEAQRDDENGSGVHPRLSVRPEAKGVLVASASVPPPDGATFDAWFERGVEALLRKQFDDAYEAFSAAERCGPGDARVRANLARLEAMGFGGKKKT